MAQLRISCLGTFQVTLDGQIVTGFDSDRVRILLVYLLLGRKRPFRRKTLAETFWPETAKQVARTNLRSALANLRRILNDRAASTPFLFVTRQTIQFNEQSNYWADVVQFERVAQQKEPTTAQLMEITALARGPFLAGFSVANSFALEEWLLLKREQLQRYTWEAHYTLAKHEAANGRFSQALHHAQCQIEMDPLQEASHRQQMRYLCYTNRRNEALSHFQTLYDILQTELSISPDAKTQRLYESILDGEVRSMGETAVPDNLPPQPTPFVGRDEELESLDTLIATPKCRLITIQGVGGAGKTRLALAVAQRQAAIFVENNGNIAPRFPDGIYFVPLADLQTADEILPTLIEVLNLRAALAQQKSQSPLQPLLNYLHHKRILLIMDNFEHLLDGGNLLTHILQNARDVQILVTSREQLHLRHEQIFHLAGLTYPPPNDNAKLLKTYTAVQLFQQTATRIQPNFQLCETNMDSLTTICQLVEGMPLAIELIAAWIETQPLPIMAEQLKQSLDLLKADYRDVPERHRSMAVVFDTSWQQLNSEAQQVLARLSVFQGDFSAQAASAVAGASSAQLQQFIHKSLLQQQNGRFQLHPLLRQYCAARLAVNVDEKTAVQHQHSRYYCNLLAEVQPQLSSRNQIEAFSRIEENIKNVTAAWRWSVSQKNLTGINQAAESMARFFIQYGRLPEGKSNFALAVTTLEPPDSPTASQTLIHCLTWLAACETDFEQANQHCQRGFDLLAQPKLSRLKAEKAHLLLRYGRWLMQIGKREEAMTALEESYRIFKKLDFEYWYILALGNIGLVHYVVGDYQKARELNEAALHSRRKHGSRLAIADGLDILSEIAFFQGDIEQGERWSQESMSIYRELNHIHGIVSASYTLGIPLSWQGNFEQSLLTAQERLTLAEKHHLPSTLDLSVATNHLHLAHYETTHVLAEQCVHRYQKASDARSLALSLSLIGWTHLANEAYQQADLFLKQSESIYLEINQPGGLGWVQFSRGLAAIGLGNLTKAQQWMHDALKTAVATQDYSVAVCALVGTAVLLTYTPNTEYHQQAITLYAAANRYPWVAQSRWFEDVAGRFVTAVSHTFSQKEINTAAARGKALDLWETVNALELALLPSQHLYQQSKRQIKHKR